MENSIKAFTIPCEGWYKDVLPEKQKHIEIGIYHENGGTYGEFKIVWDGVGIRLMAYNDSWEALSKMPELIELMANISQKNLEPKIDEFAEMLKVIGFKDITERERP